MNRLAARLDVGEDEKPREEVAEGVSNAPSAPSAVALPKQSKSKTVSLAQPPPEDPFRYGASKPPPEGLAAQAGIVEEPGPNPSLNAGPASLEAMHPWIEMRWSWRLRAGLQNRPR